MGFYHFTCRIAAAISLLAAGSAFAADDDIAKCKASDRYHNSAADYETCSSALKSDSLSKELRAELLLGRAEAAYFAGRFDFSSVDLDEAIGLNPNMDEAYLRRAWTRLSTNQYPGALQDITTLLSRNPDNIDALFAIGILYKDTPNWESRTMPAFKRVLELNPNHYLTRLNLALIYEYNWRDHAAAIAECDRILSAGEAELEKVRLWRDPSRPTFDFRGLVRFQRAEAIRNSGDHKTALREFDELASDYPKVPDSFIARARVHRHYREFDKVLADAKAAIKVDPWWPAQRLLEIDALYHLKRYDDALPLATKFIDETSIDFARGEAFFWRGYTNKALHQNENALLDFERSFVLSPQWLAAILTQLRQSGYYDGQVTDRYSERARNGLQACILDPECGG